MSRVSALSFKFIICKMASLSIQRQGKGLLIWWWQCVKRMKRGLGHSCQR